MIVVVIVMMWRSTRYIDLYGDTHQYQHMHRIILPDVVSEHIMRYIMLHSRCIPLHDLALRCIAFPTANLVLSHAYTVICMHTREQA